MPPRPKLTIAIPTINRAGLVKHAIDSALGQTFSDIEVIVSNNGSTDNTQSVLEQYHDPRLKVFHHASTIDPCSHGNFLLKNATGEFFLGLSDDDFIEPTFVQQVVSLFSKHPNISFVYTGCNVHYSDAVVPALIGPEIETGAAFLTAFLAGERNVCWCACASRTDSLKAIGSIPKETICGDMFFWVKLAMQGSVGCVPEPLSHYFAYQDTVRNHSTTASVRAWLAELTQLVGCIETFIIQAGASITETATISRYSQEFLARSTADQFIWNRLRGTTRTVLISALCDCMSTLRLASPSVWLRPIAAILVPRTLLLRRVLAAAERKAKRKH